MKLSATPDVSNVTDDDLRRFLTAFNNQVTQVMNGNIEFNDNTKSQKISVTFPTANAEVLISHGLARVPNGYILVGASVAMSLYDGDSSNTDKVLYLKSNAAGTAQIMVF